MNDETDICLFVCRDKQLRWFIIESQNITKNRNINFYKIEAD